MAGYGIFDEVIQLVEEDEIILETFVDEPGTFAVFAVDVDPTLDLRNTLWDFLVIIYVKNSSETWPDRAFKQLGRFLKAESQGLWTVDQRETIPVGEKNQFFMQGITLELGLDDAMPMPKGFTKRIAALVRKALPATTV